MRRICVGLLLSVLPVLVLAQGVGEPYLPPPPSAPPAVAPPPPQDMSAQMPTPPEAGPTQSPPYQNYPPAPPAMQQPTAAPAGQWVNTNQYGWIWLPYSQEYTYVPSDPQVFPDQYVYYPAYGWRWVVAPWVYGYGPTPSWGPLGLRYFVWYTRPWFRVGGYWGWGAFRGWGNYRGWIGPRTWGARGWASAPAYYRTGANPPHAHFAHAAPPERNQRVPVRHEVQREPVRRGRWER
jgi:hypothetical protein